MDGKTVCRQLSGEWIAAVEASEYLGVSVDTVRRWVTAGKLDGRKVGYRTVRISSASVERLLEHGK